MTPSARLLFSLGISALALCGTQIMSAQARVTHKKATAAAASSETSSSQVASAASSSLTAIPSPNAPVRSDMHTPTIEDAPKSDYQRVAWCHGILSGDMALAEQINALEPVDDTIQKIGRSYLRAYEAALTLSNEGKSEAGHAVAEKARKKGFDSWDIARKAEIHKAAWAYDTWQLPGDCEHAAVRLSGHPNLFAELATDDETAAINAALSSGGPHGIDELPKPKLTAHNISTDSDGPVSTNTLSIRARESAALPSVSGAASSSTSSAAH